MPANGRRDLIRCLKVKIAIVLSGPFLSHVRRTSSKINNPRLCLTFVFKRLNCSTI